MNFFTNLFANPRMAPPRTMTTITNRLRSSVNEDPRSDSEYIQRPHVVANIDVLTDNDEVGCVPDGDLPPEHYLGHWDNFDEGEYTKEDYKASTTRLLDQIREQ
jgi:hypothetical protein